MPNRFVKQLIYGSFFLSIVLSFFIAYYFFYLKPAPSCFDQKKNQNETEVDCGGVCAPCELARLLPIKVNWAKHFLVGEKRTVVAAELKNSNPDFAADFLPYQIDVFGPFGIKIKTLEGGTFIYSGEIKVFTEIFDFDPRDVFSVNLKLGAPHWIAKKQFLKPALEPRGIEVKKENSFLEVSGLVRNNQSFNLLKVKVIAVLYSQRGDLLAVSQTLVNDLPGFKDRSFSLSFPAGDWMTGLSSEKTKIFFEAKL